eukprot:3383929-Pleurochrysis_carterae.AAC.1
MEGFEEYDKTTRADAKAHIFGNNTDFLKSYGYTQFLGEPCIFAVKRDGSFLLVIVWIDDVAIAYANKDENLFD